MASDRLCPVLSAGHHLGGREGGPGEIEEAAARLSRGGAMTKRLWHTPSPDKLFKERCSVCDAVRRRLRDRSRPRWREHPIYKVRWHRYGIHMPYCPGGKP